jgi:hypothetical protein
MYIKPIFLLVKKYSNDDKRRIDFLQPDLAIEYVQTSEMLENKLKEYSYKKNIIPLVILIGTYIFNKNYHTIPTNSIIAQLKKRKKTIVLLYTTQTDKDDIENLIFEQNDNIFEILNSLASNKKFIDIINNKKILKFKKLLTEIIKNQKNFASI